MPDYRATSNMLELVRRLEHTHSGALPVNRLADDLGVNRRTVVRWLQALEGNLLDDAGEPIVRREHRSGEAWAVLVGAQAPLSATIFQYAATFAAARHLQPVRGTVLGDGAEDVLGRVEAAMRDDVRALVPRVAQAFHYVPFAPKDHAESEEVLDELVQAAIKRWRVEIDYRNMAGETSTQLLEPWSIVMYRDGFYVLARRFRGRTLRLYAVERISEARLQRGAEFQVPADFDPAIEFGRHLGLWRVDAEPERVVVAFDPAVAQTVRSRRWRGFVEWRDGADGRLELVLDVPVTPEIVSWVLGWGAMAEVLVPAGLRRRVGDEIRNTARRYDDSG